MREKTNVSIAICCNQKMPSESIYGNKIETTLAAVAGLVIRWLVSAGSGKSCSSVVESMNFE